MPTDHVTVDAATVICVRQSSNPTAGSVLRAADFSSILNKEAIKQLRDFNWSFDSGFEILMGQNEVVNWVRSEEGDLSLMRCVLYISI